MKFKKITALLLAGVMTFSMTACGKPADSGSGNNGGKAEPTKSEAAKPELSKSGVIPVNSDPANTKVTDETLRVGIASEPSNLWDASCGKTENEAELVNSTMLDTLVVYDRKAKEVKPNLATSWKWVDPTHCQFKLRNDVTMTSGKPMVADDVVYTVGIWKKYDANTDTGRYIKGAKADDKNTVTIEFTVAAPDILSMMSWSNFGIVSKDDVDAAGGIKKVGTNPVIGSGKYKFKEWKRGQSITLERNEKYWNKDYKGYYKTIVFTFTNDAAAREMAVESGDSDVAYDMPISQAATYAKSSTVSTAIYPTGQIDHLWYNMGKAAGATKDQKVRQAIDKVLDYDAIAKVGTAGFGTASLAYMDQSCPFYQEQYAKDERKVDIEGAKKLLKEAGYSNGLKLTALGLQDIAPVYTVMQENLAKIGIQLKINTPDVAQFVQDSFAGKYDIILVNDDLTVRTPAIIPFLVKINAYGPGVCVGGNKWTTDQIDKDITNLIQETDESKLKDDVSKITTVIKDKTLCSNLYQDMKSSILAKGMKGYYAKERGFIDVTTLYK